MKAEPGSALTVNMVNILGWIFVASWAKRCPSRVMKVISEKRWVCSDRGPSPPRLPNLDALQHEHWLVHGVGCIRLVWADKTLSIRLDVRFFNTQRCEQLIAELRRPQREVSTYRFEIQNDAGYEVAFSGAVATSLAETVDILKSVASNGSALGAVPTIQAVQLSFERLLLERRRIFDEVVAAWLLDRAPQSAAIGRLFSPEREAANEGVKIVRRVEGDLVFDAYRTPLAHTWAANQKNRILNRGLNSVLDLRLAQTLIRSTDLVRSSRAPVLERVTGTFLCDAGYRAGTYHRLSLPLNSGPGIDPPAILVATSW